MVIALTVVFWLLLIAIVSAPFLAVALVAGLVMAIFMGVILLLWAITENVALSLLIFSAIVCLNLIVHREGVKTYLTNKLS
ncbi:hypothetical protein ACTUM7_01410 [Basfia succiniciproducens]|uniref:hypothetical protein n=1 Tax=Basfia succiniciproducens TaxID=653940 RepID=UPI003FCCB2CD